MASSFLDRKLGRAIVLLAVAAAFLAVMGAVHGGAAVGEILTGIPVMFAPGGPILSSFLVMFGWLPWQGLSIQLAVVAMLFAVFAWRGAGRFRRGNAAVAVLFAAGSGLCWVYFPGRAMAYEEDGFPVARFVKTADGGGERQLVFIGEQHISDLEYYMAMDGEIRRLTGQRYVFAYEETDAHHACWDLEDFGDLGLNTASYNIPTYRYYVDVIRSPFFWPSAEFWSDWHRVDLWQHDRRVKEVRAAAGTALECVEAVLAARDAHLLQEIDGSDIERLAVVYGSAHLRTLRGPLVAKGWREVDLVTLPPGRRPFKP